MKRYSLSAAIGALVLVFLMSASGVANAQSGIITGLSQLTKDEAVDLYPNAAKTENRILFESFKDKNFEVIMMGTDGIPKRLTTDEEDNNNVAWLKGDEGVLFDSFRQKTRGVWMKSLRVGGDQQISRGKTVDFDADSNPVNGRIVFCAIENEKDSPMRDDGERWFKEFKNEMPFIWMVNPDGSGLTQLIKGLNPVWSPDGERLAFASNVTGNYELYSIKPDGSGLLQLTSRPDVDIEPTWSPDGRKIAFTSNVNKDWNLWMMNADGTGLTQLTVDPELDGGPSWGKDGFIYFHSERSGNYDIWKFKPAGYEPVPDDTDGDGLADKKDKCPDQAEDIDNFQDEDGCPDPDNDNDGVKDADDKCPTEAEDKNGYKDDDGCPDNNPLAGGLILYIEFMAGNTQVNPSSFFQLDQAVEKLKGTTGTVEVRGYTASPGADAANLKVTQSRADAVKSYLIQRGVDAGRVISVGYGEANPIDSNNTADGRRNNNRIEIHLIQ